MKDVYIQLNRELEFNNSCILVTLIDKKGSVPQGVGSTMLVSNQTFGTIGGGSLEANAIEIAKQMLVNNETSKVMKFDLSNSPFNMICGGYVELFFNVISSQTKLYVFGSGHVAEAIYKVFSNLDFSIVFLDDRVELLENFPNTCVVNYDELDINCNDCYVIVATRSHELDFKVVNHIKNQEFLYLGILGSKKKSKQLFEETGITNNNVFAPIGLKVSNQNPAEIAISIAAQILAHKNNYKEYLYD